MVLLEGDVALFVGALRVDVVRHDDAVDRVLERLAVRQRVEEQRVVVTGSGVAVDVRAVRVRRVQVSLICCALIWYRVQLGSELSSDCRSRAMTWELKGEAHERCSTSESGGIDPQRTRVSVSARGVECVR